MRWLARLSLAWALALLACMPAGAASPAPLVLRDAQRALPSEALAAAWLDPGGAATIDDALRAHASGRFAPAQGDRIHALGDKGALWLHLRLLRARDARLNWLLEFPMPVLDTVTVYQRQGTGWHAESAGDNLAVEQWPERGRHPVFQLDLPAGEMREVFVRIRHTTPANFPVALTASPAHNQRVQLEYLGLGLTFGALLLLISACLTQSWVYRDRVYAWYAFYALLTAFAVAAYTGVAAHLLWPGFDLLGDAPQASLCHAAAGAALLFVRKLIGIPARLPVLYRLVGVLGYLGFAMAIAHPMLPKVPALSLLAAYIVSAAILNMSVALAAWRRGDVVGAWVFAAYVPLTGTVAMGVLRVVGVLPVNFATQYAVVIAMAIEVPLLLVALAIRSRERHGAQIREQALSTHDALTGLLAPHLFHDRLRQVVSRFRRDHELAAVVFIDLVNHAAIKQRHGPAVAEQSLLRTVIKLRRILRDVDTVSRVGEARFGIVLEGVSTRVAITDRAARLIAAGLMPLQGLKPEVTLQFHIAAVLLQERCMDAGELVEALGEVLARMSPRTRRPIRFVQPEHTIPAPLEADSSLLSDEDPHTSDKPPLAAAG